jgi:hypothetical protein
VALFVTPRVCSPLAFSVKRAKVNCRGQGAEVEMQRLFESRLKRA